MANFSGDVSVGARYSPVVLSSGAGRFVDTIWPDPLQTVSTASSVTQARNRLYNTQLAFSTGGFGGGGATLNMLAPSVYGQLAVRLAGGAADGVGQIARMNLPCPQLFQVQGRTLSGVPSSDYQPLAVFRVYAVYALTAFGTAGGNQDCGLELTENGALIQSQATKGLAFGRSAQGVITARSQTVGGGAGSTVAVTGAGTTLPNFDESKMNAYEIQGVSALVSAEATVTWLINGSPIRRLSYGAGSVLPPFSSGIFGCWTAMLVNVAKLVNLDATVFHAIQAPTLQDCY